MFLDKFQACPTTLNDELKAQYLRDGYLAFSDVLTQDEVEKANQSLTDIANYLRETHKELRNSYGEVWADEGNSGLMIQFEKNAAPTGSDDPELELKIRKYHNFVQYDSHLGFLAKSQSKIQGVLNGLIGTNPILMQNMALVKPPFYGSEKPWHQDDAYFKVAPLEAVCGVWIALDEATAENGCMFVLRGGHRTGALRHFHGTDCEIVHDRLCGELDRSKAVPVPLPAGGALFFSGILPHQTPPNSSPLRRRALQFHYRSQDSRLLTDEEYDLIFREHDGTPASCSAANRRGF
jgi:phytanoyl-CoA hydroxylase